VTSEKNEMKKTKKKDMIEVAEYDEEEEDIIRMK
jgi:hypothetical protein